jgi:hypothetical protein
MPETALWALVITCASLAFAGALKLAEYRRTIQHMEKELSAARPEKRAFKVPDNNDIQDVESTDEHGLAKADPDLDKPIHSNDLLWLGNDVVPYCPVCYETRGIKIHMLLGRRPLVRPARYYCPGCYFMRTVSTFFFVILFSKQLRTKG